MDIENKSAAELTALLGAEVSFEHKARAAQRLAGFGGADAVPALAGLLADERLADHARIALQVMPFPEAAAALRAALDSTTGRTRAGVIGSLGERRDASAVPAIAGLLERRQSGAAAALGKIADSAAAGALLRALGSGGAEENPELRDAALACAATLIRNDEGPRAAELLQALLAAKPPRFAADAAETLLVRARAIRLFDGRTLDGWEGNRDWFRVEDGAVVAGSLEKPVPQNEFLATTREFGDFELWVKVRLRHAFTNGGVQLRSKRVAGSGEMCGYQADAAAGHWGGLYDESRRNRFLGEPALPAERVAATVRGRSWNEYRIRCEGPRCRLWLNGLLTLDYRETDDSVSRSGLIALQIHSGPPSEVDYRDIYLTPLASHGKD